MFQGFENLSDAIEKKNSHFLHEYVDFSFKFYESWNFPFDFVPKCDIGVWPVGVHFFCLVGLV